jgi:hypothetical protein
MTHSTSASSRPLQNYRRSLRHCPRGFLGMHPRRFGAWAFCAVATCYVWAAPVYVLRTFAHRFDKLRCHSCRFFSRISLGTKGYLKLTCGWRLELRENRTCGWRIQLGRKTRYRGVLLSWNRRPRLEPAALNFSHLRRKAASILCFPPHLKAAPLFRNKQLHGSTSDLCTFFNVPALLPLENSKTSDGLLLGLS